MRRRRTWILAAWLLWLCALLGVTVQGCSGGTVVYHCPLPLTGRYDPPCSQCGNLGLLGCCDGYVDPFTNKYVPPPAGCSEDGGTDGGVGMLPDAGKGDAMVTIEPGGSCPGTCVDVPPLGWEGPVLTWFGTEGTAPTCPSNAPVIGYQGHADLVQPPPATCAACTCSASSGTCSPPAHMEASPTSCPAGQITVAFDPPAGWTGTTCTASDAIPAGLMCGGSPCVQSLTSDPPLLAEDGCAASTTRLVNASPASWSTAVLGCRATGDCGVENLMCQPSIAQGSGFLACIFSEGDNPCPPSYPDKHVAYMGFDDQRACSPCACGAPDSACTATLRVFTDMACTDVLTEVTIDTPSPTCIDLSKSAAGTALGSKQLINLTYLPGSCPPTGGEPSGAVVATGAATFCCLA